MPEKKEPQYRKDSRPFSFALWNNDNGNNKWYTVQISRGYYDRKTNGWKNQRLSLPPEQIDQLLKALKEFNDEIAGQLM